MLDHLKEDSNVQNETDSLGFQPLDSNIYDCKITKFFLSKSSQGATAVNVHVKTAEGKSSNFQLWATSNKKKGCKNYYEGKDGKKNYLPGFNVANALCLLTLRKPISKMETEPTTEDIFGTKTKVDSVPAMIGQDIKLGIIKRRVNKQVKNEDTGNWEDGPEARHINEVDKVFRHADMFTTTEIRAKAETADFHEKWLEKWEGEVDDRFKDVSGATQGAPQEVKAGAQADEELF